MTQVPNEIEKISVDIKATMQVYDILEEFGYQFRDDDDYDKKWRVYGSPQETESKIEKQQ